MYEYIKGLLTEITPTYAVIEAGGVGYFLSISLQTFSEIEKHESTTLYTHFIVREDVQLLYGFASKQERDIFRLLIGVSGVGGNTARMILSTYTPKELSAIISTENDVLLKKVKGLGLKTAQKIIVELKDKITMAVLSSEQTDLPASTETNSVVYNEALAALTMLGFSKAASDKALKPVVKENPSASVEDIIRLTLKKL